MVAHTCNLSYSGRQMQDSVVDLSGVTLRNAIRQIPGVMGCRRA